LKGFIESDDYEVLVTQLDDKYGEYGKIGLALLKKDKQVWDLKLLLMSCRVMAKGIGNVMMNYIFNMAKTEGAVLRAQFIPTDRNRIMYITYKFNGFKEIGNNGNVTILEADMSHDRLLPDYVTVLEEG
jgi:FkbH-like protein